MKPNDALVVPKFAKPFELKATRRVTKTTGKPNAGIMITFPTTSIYQHDDSYALKVLFAVMAGYYHPGGWLHEELRGQRLVYVVHGYNYEGPAPGHAVIYAQCEPDKVEEVIKRIEARLQQARTGRIAARDFTEARQRVLAFEEIQDQTSAEQAQRAALDELYGLGHDHRRRFLRGIGRVQLPDLKRVAQKYFGNHLICITTPGKKG